MKPDNQPNLTELFLNGVPLMDTRAPMEFNQGAFPSAVSLPLMFDDERAKVGTCYKHSGQEAAIKLGHKLVSGATKEERLHHWIAHVKKHPEGYLYCFRGGLRSQTVQQWLKEAGYNYPLIHGGYKALRKFLMDSLNQQSEEKQFVILSGRTGTGKTRILNQLPGQLDLEHYANHRGSSFGRHVSPQPTQINFEHNITIDLLRNNHDVVFVEDESQVIGSVHIPDNLLAALNQSHIIVIEKTMDQRIDVVIEDYVIDLSGQFIHEFGTDEGFRKYSEYMLSGIDRIRKRLGGVKHKEIKNQISTALEQQVTRNDLELHRIWIANLLNHYYDKMYDYQLSRKQERVLGISTGNPEEIQHIARNIPM